MVLGLPDSDGWHQLRIDLADPVTGREAAAYFRFLKGQGSVRSWVRLTNRGPAPVTVESVTSFLCGGLASDGGVDNLSDLDLLWCENDWLAEGRWQRRPLRDALPDLCRNSHGGDPRGRFGISGAGTWSCAGDLPMGAISDHVTGHAWAWQVEHNGAWLWEVGESRASARRRGEEAAGT